MFQVAGCLESRPDPFTWPLLAVSPDQCSIGVACLNFLCRFLLLNIDILYDFNHGGWNDEKKSMYDCGLKPWLLLMLIAFNVMDGPWSDSGRYNESWEALCAAARSFEPTEMPLFMSLLPMMACEMGFALDQPDVASKVWHRLFTDGPLRKKGYKCNLNRFYGFITVGIEEISMFWQKLFIFLYVSLEMDYIGGACKQKLTVAHRSASSAAESMQSTTSSKISTTEEKALRSSCGNAYGIATMMYSDPANLFRLRIIISAGLPL